MPSVKVTSSQKKRFEEERARLILLQLYPERYRDAELQESPDIVCKTNSIGIEVTSNNITEAFINSALGTMNLITDIEEIGSSVENRKLLAFKIFGGKNEILCPKVFLTSSMHGDEVCGFVLMLRLIDFLLTNKDTNKKEKKIVENIVLYINPLANPDGTYSNSEGDLSRSKRYNANNEDLNRDFQLIGSIEKTNFQPETAAMQEFSKKHNFTLSANFHAGDEVVNFPWDSFYESEFDLPDKEWFIEVSKQYVDSARLTDKNYLKSVNSLGYVFGSEWYKVSGGRQDYMMYFRRCREFTIEFSNSKLLDREELEEQC